MLHDPSHYEPPPVAEEIKLAPTDTDILRRLASELAKIAALPVHKEKARLWQQLNDLRSQRPMPVPLRQGSRPTSGKRERRGRRARPGSEIGGGTIRQVVQRT